MTQNIALAEWSEIKMLDFTLATENGIQPIVRAQRAEIDSNTTRIFVDFCNAVGFPLFLRSLSGGESHLNQCRSFSAKGPPRRKINAIKQLICAEKEKNVPCKDLGKSMYPQTADIPAIAKQTRLIFTRNLKCFSRGISAMKSVSGGGPLLAVGDSFPMEH